MPTDPVSSKSLDENNTLSNRSNDTCQASNRPYHFVDISVHTTIFFIQLFLIIAIVMHRKKLLGNQVNLYAANVVFANFSLSFFATLSAFLDYYGYTREQDAYNKVPFSFRYFWLFMKSLTIIMFLVIYGGICLLTLTVKNNVFRVHRTIAGMSRGSVAATNTRDLIAGGTNGSGKYSSLQWIKKHPKTFATILISIVWIIPLSLSSLNLYNNRCLEMCYCLINYIPQEPGAMSCPLNAGCHIVWPAFSNRAILAASCFWLVWVLVLVALFSRSYYNFRMVLRQREFANAQLRNSVMETQRENGYRNEVLDVDSVSGREDTLPHPPSVGVQFAVSRTLERNGPSVDHEKLSASLLSKSLKKNLYNILIVAVIFILGSGPLVIFAFAMCFESSMIDALDFHEIAVIPFIILPSVSALINSILLCSKYSGLSAAVKKLVNSLMTCRLLQIIC